MCRRAARISSSHGSEEGFHAQTKRTLKQQPRFQFLDFNVFLHTVSSQIDLSQSVIQLVQGCSLAVL